MSCNINQFQDVYFIGDKNIVVDYLFGRLVTMNRDQQDKIIERNYSVDYENYEKVFLDRTAEISEKNICTIVLIPSYNCNMECEYCYEGHNKIASIYMKESVGENIIKFISKSQFDCVDFILLGGEPIYGKNILFLESFFNNLSMLNVKYNVSCVSNGLEVVDNIDIIKNMRINYIQLTLDGLECVHNRRKICKVADKNPFKEVCKAINILLKNKIEISLRINVDESNVDQLSGIANLIKGYKWNRDSLFSSYIYPITYSGNDKEKKYKYESEIFDLVIQELIKIPDAEKIFELDFHGVPFVQALLNEYTFIPKKNFCASCQNQLVFDGNNNVYTCWWGANNRDFQVGLVDENSVVINDDKIKRWHEHSVQSINKCKRCRYKFICGGGCVFKANENYGSINEGNCSEFYKIIKLYLEYKFVEESTYRKLMYVKCFIIRNFIRKNKNIIILAEGDSMLPSIRTGEKVNIYYDIANLIVGDIVLYKSNFELKLHRIIEKKEEDFYLIKGDAEDFCEYVHITDIYGKKVDYIETGDCTEELIENIGNCKMKIIIKKNQLVEVEVHNE